MGLKKYKTICFDIDGVLTVETNGHDYDKRTPNPKNIAILKSLYEKRSEYRIVLFTSRYHVDATVTIQWLKDNGVRYDEIIFGKPQYDFIIDDKAIHESELSRYFGNVI